MAEPENIDDEFFDDLYNDDEPTAATTAKPVQPEESMSDAPELQAHDGYAEQTDQNGAGDAGPANEDEEDDEDSDDDIDFNLGNSTTHVPSAGMPVHQPSPTPSATPVPPPPPSTAPHTGHHKNSSSKEDG